MVSVFVVHLPVTGNTITELPLQGDPGVWYLPNDPKGDEVELSHEPDEQHSLICLEINSDVVLLRVFDGGECFVLGDGRSDFRVPHSTPKHFKSILLRGDTQFLTSMQHRWEVRWYDEEDNKSNSMRPPPLPVVSNNIDTTPPDEITKEIMQLSDDGGSNCTPATQNTSSQPTASPTPSPHEPESQSEMLTTKHDANDYIPDGGLALTNGIREEPVASKQKEATDEESNPPNQGAPLTPPSESEASETPSDAVEEGHAEKDVDAPSKDCRPPDVYPTPTSVHLHADHVDKSQGPSTIRKKRKLEEIESGDIQDQSEHNGEHIPRGEEIAGIIQAMGSPDPEPDQPGSIPGEQCETNIPTPKSGIATRSATIEQGSPRKRRRKKSSSSSPGSHDIPKPVVIFSGNTEVDKMKNAMEVFKFLGGRVTKSINEANLLCVPNGSLKKTSKLIMAVARGIDIVTESWVAEIQRSGAFPLVEDFLPKDPSRERLWNFSLKEAIQRGKTGLTHLLSGTTVVFTKQLRTDLGSLDRELSQIATMLGADALQNRLPALKDKAKYTEDKILVIGAPNDPQGALVERLGQKLFNKDILTMAVLRGELDRKSSEFLLEIPIKDEEGE